MKKLMLLCVLFLCAILTKAQGLGDYMEIDGVPGFVFYVDETGEHGLVMSAVGKSEKLAKKIAKQAAKFGKKNGLSKEQIALFSSPKLVIASPSKKVSSKEKKELYAELVKILDEEGEKNTELIVEFCKEKGLSLQDYFPYINWVTQLGNGWFLPGDKELTLFAEFYSGGLGKENSLGGKSIINRQKELASDLFSQTVIQQIAGLGIRSSTITDEKHGFRALVPSMKGTLSLKVKRFLEIKDKVKVKTAIGGIPHNESVEKAMPYLGTVAVHKF